jgi:hypothetical protein
LLADYFGFTISDLYPAKTSRQYLAVLRSIFKDDKDELQGVTLLVSPTLFFHRPVRANAPPPGLGPRAAGDADRGVAREIRAGPPAPHSILRHDKAAAAD